MTRWPVSQKSSSAVLLTHFPKVSSFFFRDKAKVDGQINQVDLSRARLDSCKSPSCAIQNMHSSKMTWFWSVWLVHSHFRSCLVIDLEHETTVENSNVSVSVSCLWLVYRLKISQRMHCTDYREQKRLTLLPDSNLVTVWMVAWMRKGVPAGTRWNWVVIQHENKMDRIWEFCGKGKFIWISCWYSFIFLVEEPYPFLQGREWCLA